MKKIKNAKMLLIGLILGSLLSAGITVAATGVIRSAVFNNVGVTFNSNELNLDAPLISVITEANPDFASNYMPARAVLEAMGYVVEWDSEANTIHIRSHWYEARRIGSDLESIPEEFASLSYLTNPLWEQGIQVVWAAESIMFSTDFNITTTIGRHGETIWSYNPEKTLVFPIAPDFTWTNQQLRIVAQDRDDVAVTLLSHNGMMFAHEEEFLQALTHLPEVTRHPGVWNPIDIVIPDEFAAFSYLQDILWRRGIGIIWLSEGFVFTTDIDNMSPTIGRHGETIWSYGEDQSLIFKFSTNDMWSWNPEPFEVTPEGMENFSVTFLASGQAFIHEAQLMEALTKAGLLK